MYSPHHQATHAMAQVQPVGNPAPAMASESLAYGTPQYSSGLNQSLKPRPIGQPTAGPQVWIAPGLPPSPASTPQQQAHQQGPLGAAYAAASPPSVAQNFSPASSGAVTGPGTPEQSAGSLRLTTTPEPSGERSQAYASPAGSLALSSGSSFSSAAAQPGYKLSPMPAGSRVPSATVGAANRVSPIPGAPPSGNTLKPLPSPFSCGTTSSGGQPGQTVLPTASRPVLQQHNPMPMPSSTASATATPPQTSAAASFGAHTQPAASLQALKPANPNPVSAYPSNPTSFGPAAGPAAQPASISFRQVGLTPGPAPVELSTTGQQQQQQQQYPQPGGQQQYVGLPRPFPTPEQHHQQYAVLAGSQAQLQPQAMVGRPVPMPAQPSAGQSAYPPMSASVGGSFTVPTGAGSSGLGFGHQGHYPAVASNPVPVQSAAFSPTMTHPQKVDHTPQHGPCYHTSKPCHQHNNNGKAAKKVLSALGTLLGACLVGMCEAACDHD